ncbi:hypothetical protein RYZ20_00425 [Thioclava sp. A2]|uniref:hypothetical protein n=1 Tax=Thioclava sp. FCG-A2 TaxID=3080562 RepID=UPI002952C7EF|nr:hypothetical protein [Thioclava sp. A2]MDV7269360.1 hypothetical protein [Thioclava sp. A2]
MRKTLWIHIGHFKTGTTALQVFCAWNKANLAKHGISYSPECQKHSKHSKLAFSLYRQAGITHLMHGFANDTPAKEHWDVVLNEALSNSAPATLISSEEFMRLGSHPDAEQLLASIIEPWRNKFDFRVVAYLRSPDAHLHSWYNQLIKMSQPIPDFNAAVTSVMEAVHYDYALALAPWRRIFGDGAINIRAYRDDFKNSTALYSDFLATLDVQAGTDLSDWKHPQKDVNPRMDEHLLQYIRIANRLNIAPEGRDWLKKRICAVLEGAQDGGHSSFKEIISQSQQGLELIDSELPHGLDIEAMLQDSPRPDESGASEMQIALEIALGEIAVLRRQQRQSLKTLSERLDALEKLPKGRLLR